MGNEAANVETLRKGYRLWHETRGKSVDHWMTLVDDDIQFGSLLGGAPEAQFTRSYSNREALRGYFDGLLSEWEMIHYTVREFVAQGDAVVARGVTAWRNRKSGISIETPKVDFWRFRDGKAIEFFEYFDTARVVAAAQGQQVAADYGPAAGTASA